MRSFFNNIADLSNPSAVTIDTQAVAAAHPQPFPRDNDEVAKTMGGTKDAELGLSGTSHLRRDVFSAGRYVRLADEMTALAASASCKAPGDPKRCLLMARDF